AYDISADAVATARRNADCLGADVHFFVADALAPLPNADKRYDIIVSNPPYICESERRAMEKNVLDYEPGAALFVPDSNPLLFYQAITDYAAAHLYNNGRLYFEVNPDYADEVATYVISNGFTQAKVIEDSFGKKRFVEALL
ncbi:MAG: methyltransferase, partial [Prevotellaceae bacterium]|nr:methyltransferase [Prevotellaceae bacterium]